MKTQNNHHDEETVERLETTERRIGKFGLILIALVAAAVAIAFFTMTGHFIW